jgi:hypothetical protein
MFDGVEMLASELLATPFLIKKDKTEVIGKQIYSKFGTYSNK